MHRDVAGLAPRAPAFADLVERARSEWLPQRAGERHQKQTLRLIRQWWLPLRGEVAVVRIKRGQVAAVVASARKSGMAPATCNRILAAGSVILEFARALDFIEYNPAHGKIRMKEPKRRKTVLTVEQIDALIAALEHRWQAYIGLMAYAGLRRGEAWGLRWEDIDLDRGVLTVRRSGAKTNTPKSKRDRDVPIVAPLRELLAPRAGRPKQRVATHEDCKKALSRAAQKAGIEVHVHPHLLRHSFGSALARDGVPPVMIQKLMGHADLASTAIYMHVDVAADRVAQVFERHRKADGGDGDSA